MKTTSAGATTTAPDTGFHLDVRFQDAGRRGLRKARAALEAARHRDEPMPPTPEGQLPLDLPAVRHHRPTSHHATAA